MLFIKHLGSTFDNMWIFYFWLAITLFPTLLAFVIFMRALIRRKHEGAFFIIAGLWFWQVSINSTIYYPFIPITIILIVQAVLFLKERKSGKNLPQNKNN